MATWYVATTGNDSTGTGASGSPYASIARALTSAASGDTIAVQSGTYTTTATTAIGSALSNLVIQGYHTTPGDGGTKPLITTATSSINLFSNAATNGTLILDNLSFSNTAATRGIGIFQSANGNNQTWAITNCIFDGFTDAINSDNQGVRYNVANIVVSNTEIKNSSGFGLKFFPSTVQASLYVAGCYFHANATHIEEASDAYSTILERSLFVEATADSLSLSGGFVVHNCTIANNAGKGILGTTIPYAVLLNNIFYGNNYGMWLAGVDPPSSVSRDNAFGANTNGNVGWPAAPGDVTLTANPFNNMAGHDYSLNSAAGGGAACKGAGVQFGAGAIDTGGVQSASGAPAAPPSNSGFAW